MDMKYMPDADVQMVSIELSIGKVGLQR